MRIRSNGVERRSAQPQPEWARRPGIIPLEATKIADSSVRRPTRAVLPFENLGAAADDYFADGIADAIRGKLASVPGLEVIARGSSTPYKKTSKTPQEIARELNARYLLTATVRWQKSGTTNRVQVSPELVEIKESEAPATKWQQPFDASLTDVFQVQSEIAAKVVDALGVALAEKQEQRLADAPTKNVAAYDAYLKGEEATTAMARADVPALRKGLGFYERPWPRPEVRGGLWPRLTCRRPLQQQRAGSGSGRRRDGRREQGGGRVRTGEARRPPRAGVVLPGRRARSVSRSRGVPQGREARAGDAGPVALDRPRRDADGPLAGCDRALPP